LTPQKKAVYIWSVRDGQLDVVVGCDGSDGTLAVVTEEVQYLPFQCQKGRAAEIQTGWYRLPDEAEEVIQMMQIDHGGWRQCRANAEAWSGLPWLSHVIMVLR
jgi:hypothetical protein